MKTPKPDRYLGPCARAQAHRDAAAKHEKATRAIERKRHPLSNTKLRRAMKPKPNTGTATVYWGKDALKMTNGIKVKTIFSPFKPLKPFTRIRRRTTKRAAEERKYRARVKVWIKEPENTLCKACPVLWKPPMPQPQPSTQCHHTHGRRGRLLLYEPFWLPVCEDCHNVIHKVSPEAAREAGVLCEIGQWNDQSIVP